MGHGIVQSFAINGYEVNIFDADTRVLKSVPDLIYHNVRVFLKLTKVKKTEIEKCIRNVHLCDDIGIFYENVDFIIETIKGNLMAKATLYDELERNIDSNVITGSNTSAINITRLRDGLKHKQRFMGTHFWNPSHIMPCVEVIKEGYTSDTVFETVFETMKKIEKEPVKVLKNVPGFFGNRLQQTKCGSFTSIE